MARSFRSDRSERTYPITDDGHETVPMMSYASDPLPATRPISLAREHPLASRNRLLIAFGVVFFLVAATLVIVAQNLVRRPDAAIMIPAGQ